MKIIERLKRKKKINPEVKFKIDGKDLGRTMQRIDEANPEIGEDLKKLQKRIAQIETPKRFKLGDKVEFNNYFMYPPKVGKVVDTIFHEADKGSHYWEYVIWVKKEKASHRFHDTKYLLFTSIQHYKPTSKSKKKR